MAKPSIMTRVRARIPGVPRGPREMLGSLQVLTALRAEGWHRSVTGGEAVTANGEPRPWLTYAAAAWLDQVLTRQTRLFEYGAGSSTAWFAGRVGEIIAVEHDEAWFARLSPPRNGRILLRPYGGGWWDADGDIGYVRAIERGAPWHVVVVDGTARTACARAASEHLTPDGLVVLDDTDRAKSGPAQRELSGRGLGRLDFWGFKPGIGTRACTTVFGRDLNPWLRHAAAHVGSLSRG